jgi:hypothetical protein
MSVEITALQVASYVAAGLLAGTKLIKIAQPFWSKLPRWATVLMPVLVLDLPMVAGYLAGAHTETALVHAAVTSIALLLPGIAEAETAPPV